LPTFATCAFKSEDADDLAFTETINLFVNFLGFCSGTIPVTVVKEGETFFEEPFHNDVQTLKYRNSMKGAEGMPIGL